jgi:signal transduction histidine kinase
MRHDILNDIAAVEGYVKIYEEHKTQDVFDELMDTLKRGLVRSRTLIGSMRELEKAVSSGQQLEEVDVAEMVEETRKEFGELTVHIDGNAKIAADAAFSSVLINLYRNARVHGKAKTIDISVKEVGDMVEIHVADDGKGIPNDVKSHLFVEGGKFGETGHTGLGLFIIKKTIERYGGSVHIEDNVPHGVQFVLTVPKVK